MTKNLKTTNIIMSTSSTEVKML